MGDPASCDLAIFLLLICSGTPIHAEFSDSVPACSVEWQVDWNDVPENIGVEFFQNPGEIVEGVTVRDMMQFLGLAWNDPSWQEIVGLTCVNFGPLLNEVAGDDRVRRECEIILRSLRAGERTRIYDSCIRVLEEIGADKLLTTSLDLYFTYDPDFNKYELETVTNLLPVAFELLEWLGPSPFSFDLHGACSALRIILSTGMSVEDILQRITNICTYPMAVFLESLSDHGVCRPLNLVPGSGNALQVELLDVLFEPRGGTCRFFLSNPDHEEFVDRAGVIVDNAVAFLADSDICEGILAALNGYTIHNASSVFDPITGYTLSSASSREALCRKLTEAFDPDSSFRPVPYVLAEVKPLEDFSFGYVPGEILPGYSFDDCLDVTGAFRRADTLAQGIEILCDVFEGVFMEASPESARDIAQMCRLLRAGVRNLAVVEDACLDLADAYLPTKTYRGIKIPLSVRELTPYYMGAIGLEFYRQLFEPSRISEEDACRALDRVFNSENNLQSVTRHAVDVWLAELIPMTHRICGNYTEVSAYYEARNYVTASYFRWISDFILAHLGYLSPPELCRVIADGIDPMSGRATDEVVERFQQELLAFLSNQGRCEVSANSFLATLGREVGVIRDTVTPFTGYSSTDAICEDLENFFTMELCNPCNSMPCRNDGSCITLGLYTFACECGLEYTGKNCEFEPDDLVSPTTTWTVGVLLAIFLGIVVFIVICQRYRLSITKEQEPITFKPRLQFRTYATGLRRVEAVEDDFQSVEILDHGNVKQGELLGRGQFGKVYEGEAILQGHDSWTVVAIKKPKEELSDAEQEDFKDEIRRMLQLGKHRNIISVLGCATVRKPFFMLTEFMEYGDLLQFVRKATKEESWTEDGLYKITTFNQLEIARQIANGMSYVSQTRFLHGDLAARNVLVGKDLHIRITDFGLTDELYQKDYARFNSGTKRPYKWYSPESIENKFCTLKTDVWSFGILLWEIVTFGQHTPYHGMSITDILYRLKAGYRMTGPSGLPHFMDELMQVCWQIDPGDRPDFLDLFGAITYLMERGADDSDYITAEEKYAYEVIPEESLSLIEMLNLEKVDKSEVDSSDSAYSAGYVMEMAIPACLPYRVVTSPGPKESGVCRVDVYNDEDDVSSMQETTV